MTWTPPDGPARLSWRLGHSAWVLAPIVGFGCLGGLGFLYVGIRAGRAAWWIPGIVYTVLGWLGVIVGGQAKPDTVLQNVFLWIWVAAWFASIIHALVVNGSWLRWRAGYQPWYHQPRQAAWAGGPPPATTPLPPYLQDVVPPQQQYYTTPPAYQAPVPVDVNTATEQQLTALPGVGPERAAQIVLTRHSRGGFVSVTDFAAAAGLAPHEFVAVRDRLTCSPPVPPDDTAAGPYGRVVDV